MTEAAEEVEDFQMGGIAVRGNKGASCGIDGVDSFKAASAQGVFNCIENFGEVLTGMDEIGEGVDVETLPFLQS